MTDKTYRVQRRAAKLTGTKDKAASAPPGLKVLNAHESARRLAQLGESEKGLRPVRRRRPGKTA